MYVASYPGLLPPKNHLRIINTYGACARGGGRRPGYEAICMYVSVTLRNSRATRKRSITCASVTLRNVTAVPAIEVRGGRSPPRTTIVSWDVGDAVRTQRSGGQPEYKPIRAACNRLAQLSTCTYLLQRRCDSGERRVRSTRHLLREALYCVCVSLVIVCCRSISEAWCWY